MLTKIMVFLKVTFKRFILWLLTNNSNVMVVKQERHYTKGVWPFTDTDTYELSILDTIKYRGLDIQNIIFLLLVIALIVLIYEKLIKKLFDKIPDVYKENEELKEQLNKALSLLDQVQDINNRLDDLEHNNKEYHRKE